jgi:hypothetical protein
VTQNINVGIYDVCILDLVQTCFKFLSVNDGLAFCDLYGMQKLLPSNTTVDQGWDDSELDEAKPEE